MRRFELRQRRNRPARRPPPRARFPPGWPAARGSARPGPARPPRRAAPPGAGQRAIRPGGASSRKCWPSVAPASSPWRATISRSGGSGAGASRCPPDRPPARRRRSRCNCRDAGSRRSRRSWLPPPPGCGAAAFRCSREHTISTAAPSLATTGLLATPSFIPDSRLRSGRATPFPAAPRPGRRADVAEARVRLLHVLAAPAPRLTLCASLHRLFAAARSARSGSAAREGERTPGARSSWSPCRARLRACCRSVMMLKPPGDASGLLTRPPASPATIRRHRGVELLAPHPAEVAALQRRLRLAELRGDHREGRAGAELARSPSSAKRRASASSRGRRSG